jgi:thiol-disulfide isomerase/thioredoxin
MQLGRRLVLGSIAAGVVLGVVGGYVASRSGDDARADEAGDTVELDRRAELSEPGLATNDAVDGEALPDVELLASGDVAVSTADLVGQPLVVNIWYSTCEPCQRELPAFAEVHAEVGDRVRFVGVNPQDSAEVMDRFAGERGVRYELLRDPAADLIDRLGIAVFPITLFVAADGTIVEQTGALDADGLRSMIAEHFR